MADLPSIGDVVKYKNRTSGETHIGVSAAGCHTSHSGEVLVTLTRGLTGEFVDTVEASSSTPLRLPPRVGTPEIGDDVFFIPHDDGIARRGKVAAVHLLRTGEALVRIGRPDSPLCRLSEAGGTK
jgi:hypothetical protein